MGKMNGDDVVWVPSVIVKEMRGGKSFIVKSCKYLSWNGHDETQDNRSVDSSSVRLANPEGETLAVSSQRF